MRIGSERLRNQATGGSSAFQESYQKIRHENQVYSRARAELPREIQTSRERVRQTIISADVQQTVKIDEVTIGFYSKQFTQHFAHYIVLACARQDGEDWLADRAFKLLPDLVAGLGVIEPLMLLRQLVQRFGLNSRLVAS